jgi:tetratricopeptide (TPR) repeat protein
MELQGLESLYASTSRSSPDRPQLMRRLAESYVELESAARRDKAQASQVDSQADAAMEAARKKAIHYYVLIVNEYPRYAALDEVLYYLAYEYEQANDLRSARSTYLGLIKKAPRSKYVPYAYLALAELFSDEAARDPSKLELAVQAYDEVVKFPAPENRASGYAWLRLGELHRERGDMTRAVTSYRKAVAFGEAYAQLPGAEQIASIARRDLQPTSALNGATLPDEPAAPPTAPAPATSVAKAPSPAPAPAPAPAPTPAPTPRADDGFVAGSPQAASYALVVGVERYRDLPRATGARADATKFAAVLRKTLGLREDHVHLALDDRATRTDVMKELAWLKQSVQSGGRAYVYYSGHGAPDAASGTAYMLPFDGDPKLVASTAIQVDDVVKALGESKAQDGLVIVDTCFSGAGGRSQLAPGTRPLARVKDPAPPPRVAILSASAGTEISGATAAGDEGLFTHHLADALGKALADSDGDGQISLQELLDWVKPRVSREAKRDHRDQTPEVRLGSGLRSASDFIVGYGFASR